MGCKPKNQFSRARGGKYVRPVKIVQKMMPDKLSGIIVCSGPPAGEPFPVTKQV
jgi:hypothetical protein